jgi:tripartite-type tricarboxylate transporter receptor subunit TctC
MRITRHVSFIAFAVVVFVLVAGAPAPPVAAQDAASFYKGKNVTVAVGFSPGGGFDIYARLVARHIGRHIPGNPTAIVSNVPGAASLKAVQSLEVTPKDGTQIVAFNPGLISQSVIEPDKVSFRFTNVAFLGSVTADIPVCYSWHATGIKTWDDLMGLKDRLFNLGATAPGTTSYIQGAILKNMFKAPIRHITGYPGSDEQKVAMERGEIDGACGSWDSIPPDWIEGRKFHPLVRYSKAAPDYLQPLPPFVGDLGNAAQKQALTPILAVDEMYRPFIVARDIPADRLKALRAAFWTTVNDPAFVADAKRGNRNIDGPMKGEDVEAIVAEIYATTPEVVAKASEAVK